MSTLHVFFAAPRSPKWGINWWVEIITGSSLSHCAISDGEVVYDPLANGFWAHETYAARFPHLKWEVVVDAPGDPQLWRLQVSKSKPGRWNHIKRILRRQDCVAAVGRVLAVAGINMPWWIWQPCQLFDWLRAQGFHLEDADLRRRATSGVAHVARCHGAQVPACRVPERV